MADAPQVNLARVALLGRCPRCGKGRIYKSGLQLAQACSICSLSFKEHEQGDGPAFFGVLIVGALAAIGAAVTEIKYQPSYWVHAAIWLPFIVIASLLSLRWLKAALIGVQYHLHHLRNQDISE